MSKSLFIKERELFLLDGEQQKCVEINNYVDLIDAIANAVDYNTFLSKMREVFEYNGKYAGKGIKALDGVTFLASPRHMETPWFFITTSSGDLTTVVCYGFYIEEYSIHEDAYYDPRRIWELQYYSSTGSYTFYKYEFIGGEQEHPVPITNHCDICSDIVDLTPIEKFNSSYQMMLLERTMEDKFLSELFDENTPPTHVIEL